MHDATGWSSALGATPATPHATSPNVVGQKGDVDAWAAKITHGGGANRTNSSRYLFYITIMYPPVTYVDVGGYSLLQQYGDGIKVGTIV